MLLTRKELEELLGYLGPQLEIQRGPSGELLDWTCSKTFKLTRAWLKAQGKDVRANLRAIRERSVFCDCEVYFNIRPNRWPASAEEQHAA